MVALFRQPLFGVHSLFFKEVPVQCAQRNTTFFCQGRSRPAGLLCEFRPVLEVRQFRIHVVNAELNPRLSGASARTSMGLFVIDQPCLSAFPRRILIIPAVFTSNSPTFSCNVFISGIRLSAGRSFNYLRNLRPAHSNAPNINVLRCNIFDRKLF